MSKRKRPFRLSFRDRSLTFTPLGTRFVIICVLIGIAAINTGSNLLYLCTSMMLSMMIVSGILSEQALRGLMVTRRLPDEIYAEGQFAVRYNLHNSKARIPSFALAVAGYGKGGREGAPAFVLKLPPAGDGWADAPETIGVRGSWDTEGFEISTRFPFGLFRKTLRIRQPETRLVYPPVRELPRELPRELTSGYGETPSGFKGQGSEVMGIREYQSMDEARLIHWKSSARLSRLMAKEFETEHKRTVCVVLDDAFPPGRTQGQSALFEEAVALAAAVTRELVLVHDIPVAFVSRGLTVPPGSGRGQYLEILEGLSLIAPSAPDKGEHDGRINRAFAEWPCVMVAPCPTTAWAARYSGRAKMVLEAGR